MQDISFQVKDRVTYRDLSLRTYKGVIEKIEGFKVFVRWNDHLNLSEERSFNLTLLESPAS
jgi:hypothetical protein